MIFYVALDENGHRQLRGTQADARAVNKQFEQIDIPTDKAGIMAYVQELFSQVDGVPHPLVQMVQLDEELGLYDDEKVGEPEPAPTPTPAPRNADEIEDLWPNLPLAFRFHLCSLTMEDARNVDWNGTTPASAPQRYVKSNT